MHCGVGWGGTPHRQVQSMKDEIAAALSTKEGSQRSAGSADKLGSLFDGLSLEGLATACYDAAAAAVRGTPSLPREQWVRTAC